jgi:uncharacterized protein (UPF0335 family)
MYRNLNYFIEKLQRLQDESKTKQEAVNQIKGNFTQGRILL